MNSKVFPQCGIVTSLDSAAYEAKVLIPVYKYETDYIEIARNIHIRNGANDTGLEVGSVVVVSFINGDINDGKVTAWL